MRTPPGHLGFPAKVARETQRKRERGREREGERERKRERKRERERETCEKRGNAAGADQASSQVRIQEL